MLMGEAVAFVAAVEKFAGDDDGVCREMEGSCLRRMGPTHSHNLKIRFTNARQQECNIWVICSNTAFACNGCS
ncbi:hypothetical protein GUJ93_ZPchr0014g46854 [Zizania palustris]|uniref:Uncharacterized protein n=1 Tax=Zizania palustris TaxID=103762 RepID=A0A8J5T8N5_ZIZPA|nr:hypothetical protein GUJ93_ZPchr0014g46854 [Zizania palustris]